MKILGFKIDPDKSHIAEVPVPEGSIALSCIIPKMLTRVIGLDHVDLQPMINVGVPDDDEELDIVQMYVQIATTENSIEGSMYLQSIWWNNALYHLFWGIRG
jgi:hypothetical protein